MASFQGKRAPSEVAEEKMVLLRDYVAMKDFSVPVQGALMSFKTGQVITASYLVSKLLSEKAPIEEVSKAGMPIACPHCGKAFFADK